MNIYTRIDLQYYGLVCLKRTSQLFLTMVELFSTVLADLIKAVFMGTLSTILLNFPYLLYASSSFRCLENLLLFQQI